MGTIFLVNTITRNGHCSFNQSILQTAFSVSLRSMSVDIDNECVKSDLYLSLKTINYESDFLVA